MGYLKRLSPAITMALLSLNTLSAQYGSPDEARDYLLNGVNTVVKVGVPGPFLLTGQNAFPVMIGSVGGEVQAPFIAASYLGKGAVLAFGHGGYLSTQNLPKDNTQKLLNNALRWTAGKTVPKVLVKGDEPLAQLLSNQDFDVWIAEERLTEVDLNNYDVIVTDSDRLNTEEINLIQDFVRAGGGLVTSGLGWGWMQLNRDKNLHKEMPGNVLLAPAGISWINGYLEDKQLTAQKNISDLFNVDKALNLVKSTNISTANKAGYGQALSVVMQSIPVRQPAPFAIDNDFPGRVSRSAERVTKTLIFDTDIPRWHSTGLYAAPGELITVTFPPTLVGKGFYVRIGTHTDRNYHHEKWLRHPELSLQYALDKTQVEVFNPFGGLIYIEAPENSPGGTAEVRIAGAVEAPHFKLGETSRNDWISRIRNHPAPWAELEGEGLIITLQSEKIRELENPDEVIRFWDQAQENNRMLANWPEHYHRPMRITFDKQISAGYMHSGYPIMSEITNYGEQEDILDSQGDHWGFYHELGHNHQHPDWTFAGTGEVTCNWFTLYNEEFLQNKGRFVGDDQTEQKHIVNNYFKDGSNFDTWKGTAFLALHMYNQLIEVYGWQPLIEIVGDYRQLKSENRPKTDQDKMDLWFTYYSLKVGKNLAIFFDHWGMPITNAAKSKVAHLPPANLEQLLANMKLEKEPLPAGVLALFHYGSGQFIKRQTADGSEWAEQSTPGKDSFVFDQYAEDKDYFYIRKRNTNMNLRIPKRIGWVQVSYENNPAWRNLYKTTPY